MPNHKFNGHAAKHKKIADSEWTTKRRAAEICGVKVEDIQNWIRRGKLPFRKRKGLIYVRPKDVKEVRDAFAEARLRPRRWITIPEAAKLCGVGVAAIRGWIKSGCPAWGGKRPDVDKSKKPRLVYRPHILTIKRALARLLARASWPSKSELARDADIDRSSIQAKKDSGEICCKPACRFVGNSRRLQFFEGVHPRDAETFVANRKKLFESPPGWIPARTGSRPFLNSRFSEITRSLLRHCTNSAALLGFKLDTEPFPLLIRVHVRGEFVEKVVNVTHYRERQLEDILKLLQEVGRSCDPDGTVWLVPKKAEELYCKSVGSNGRPKKTWRVRRWIRDGKLTTQVRYVLTLHSRGFIRRNLRVVRERDVLDRLNVPKRRPGRRPRPNNPRFEKHIWDRFSKMIAGKDHPLQIDEHRKSIKYPDVSQALARDDWKKLLASVNDFGGIGETYGSRRITSLHSLRTRVLNIARRKLKEASPLSPTINGKPAGVPPSVAVSTIVTSTQPPATAVPPATDKGATASWHGGRVFQVGEEPRFLVSRREALVLGAAISFGGRRVLGSELETKSGVDNADRVLRRLKKRTRSPSPLAPSIELPGTKATPGYLVRIKDKSGGTTQF